MKRFPLLLLLGLCWAVAAPAAEVRALYQAEVPVVDQQEEARVAAMRTGMAEVLVRITGKSTTPLDPAVTDLLTRAANYVQQYRYTTVPGATPGEAPTLALWMSFDADSLNSVLHQRGQPVWGRARPLLLVWLAIDGPNGRHLLGAADGAPEQAVLEAEANRRGLPMRLPLLDLEDQSRVKVADVWGGFDDVVAAASVRYRPQGILIGRLFLDSQQGWHARWILRIGDDVSRWESVGADEAAALAGGVDDGADALSARFAEVGSTDSGATLVMKVDDIATLADYARVLAYLKSLAGVSSVAVDTVAPRAVTYRLATDVPTAAVVRTIGLGTVLTPVAQSTASGPESTQAELNYRLLP